MSKYLEVPETMGELREELVHFGVKGMRWGERHERKPSPRKAARQKAKQERNDAIDAARGRLASGQSSRDRDQAKADYKFKKQMARATISDRSKRRALNLVAKREWKIAKEKYKDDVYTARLTKSGAETAAVIIGAIGGIALRQVVNSQGFGQNPSSFSTPSRSSQNPIRVQAHVGPSA